MGQGRLRRGIRARSVATALFIAALARSRAAQAQSGSVAPQRVRRILVARVVDGGSVPIADATVTLSTAAGSVIATGRTTVAGLAVIRFASGDTVVRPSIQRIGYVRFEQPVVIGARDSTEVVFALEHTVQTLDTVRTGTRILSNNYTLGAAEIARSHDNIEDAYDALRKLRPNMLGDRMRDCPYVQNLWVNGRWLPVFSNEIVPFDEIGQSSRSDGSGRPPVRARFPLSHAPAGLPLAMIRPNYIAEMRYVNCNANPTAGTRSVNALFISLKAGIGFDLKHGTFVADSTSARAAGVVP